MGESTVSNISRAPYQGDGARISGYRVPGSPFVSAAVNRSIALLLLLIASPLFLVLGLLVKLTDRGPVFYAGQRLGLGRKPFTMFKFRTLKPGADRVLSTSLLAQGQQLETPIGTLLRDTRWDELPQLWNVLIGDMNLIGPRPERPEIYDRLCKHIPGYDFRFTAKPGLIGYAQLITPHGTPKRIRSLIDSYYLRRNQRIGPDLLFLGYALQLLLKRSVEAIVIATGRSLRRLSASADGSEKRRLRRIEAKHAMICFATPDTDPCDEPSCFELVDLNEEAVKFHTSADLDCEEAGVVLKTAVASRSRSSPKIKRAYCTALLVSKRRCTRKACRAGATTWEYVLAIEPLSPLNAYKLQKYFLLASISR